MSRGPELLAPELSGPYQSGPLVSAQAVGGAGLKAGETLGYGTDISMSSYLRAGIRGDQSQGTTYRTGSGFSKSLRGEDFEGMN